MRRWMNQTRASSVVGPPAFANLADGVGKAAGGDDGAQACHLSKCSVPPVLF